MVMGHSLEKKGHVRLNFETSKISQTGAGSYAEGTSISLK
jgi:hypothetical protein